MFFENLEKREMFSVGAISYTPVEPPPPNVPPLPDVHLPPPKKITAAWRNDSANNGQTATGVPSKP